MLINGDEFVGKSTPVFFLSNEEIQDDPRLVAHVIFKDVGSSPQQDALDS